MLEVQVEDVSRVRRPVALSSQDPWDGRRCKGAGLDVLLGLAVLQVQDRWRGSSLVDECRSWQRRQVRNLTTRQERSPGVQGSGCMWQMQVLREWTLECLNAVGEPSWAQAVFVLGRAAA